MRNPTIWESASRPLFVRTVWLEGSELRRGLQRHFLWDYDTKSSLEKLNSANSTQQKLADTSNLKRSNSLVLNDFTDSDDCEEDVLLIGSAKVKLHQPYKLGSTKKSKLLKTHRRPSTVNQKYSSHENYQFASLKDCSRRASDISELHSKESALAQAPQSGSAADELLAERVLHWLDLAGKEDFLKNLHELKEMEVKLSKTSKLRQDAIRRYQHRTQNPEKSKSHKTKNCQRAAITAAQQAGTQGGRKPSEAVKHITIIFNKEGQPIRLNRPAKNIDLCALSSSPGTTRRLAGSLASARLYKSAENARSLNIPKTPYGKTKTGNEGNKSLSARRRLETVADLTNCSLQKRLYENPTSAGCYNNPHDSKKQLHIFMPTLPKKGFEKVVYNTEDGLSELSHNFSELCRI